MMETTQSKKTAVLLANGLLRTSYAKTTHGLVRGPSRFRIVAVIDPGCSGADAGEVLDGVHRSIPVHASIDALLASGGTPPDVCIVGVATEGGTLPAGLRADLIAAARAGLSLVNGLHQLLGDDVDLRRLTEERGTEIIDIRRPRPVQDLAFWSGKTLDLSAPRVAVLGTDCAVGKRTTCVLLVEACRARGLRAELIYTGQTGWLQGVRHGFILDATPNDFVCGELERAILACHRETEPDVIFLEGQSSLRNPSGPCGSELILAGGAAGVILQHAPLRERFEGFEDLDVCIPELEEEVALIKLLGCDVWAVTLNIEGLAGDLAEQHRHDTAERLGVPVVLPLVDGVDSLAKLIGSHIEGDPA